MLSLPRRLMLLALVTSSRCTRYGTSGRAWLRALDPSSPSGAPFPTDRYDGRRTQRNSRAARGPAEAGLRGAPVGLPDIDVLNTLDGFNLQPRLSIPFTGAIDVASVYELERLPRPAFPTAHVTGINQIVWEPAVNTLHAESDQLLDQHTTLPARRHERRRGRRGQADRGLLAPPGSELRSRQGRADKAYRKELIAALNHSLPAGVGREDVAAASLFTTQSATALLEQVRRQIKASTPAPADFVIGSAGERTVFPLASVTSIRVLAAVRAPPARHFDPTRPTGTPVPRRGRLGRVRSVRLARLRDRVEGDPRRRQPHRRARGAGDEPPLLQPLPAARPAPAGGWPVAILRARLHRQQEREPVRSSPARWRAGDRDDRDQRRRPRLRPARNADRQPHGRRARRASRPAAAGSTRTATARSTRPRASTPRRRRHSSPAATACARR